LKPASAISNSASISLTIQEDGAVLASATRPERDRAADYILEFDAPASGLQKITGLSIEAMPHESLPGFGPGLHEGGNFVVTEVDLATSAPKTPKQFGKQAFSDVRVDHIQNGFNAKLTIDGNPGNQPGWAVAGREREPHRARFLLTNPLTVAPGGKLRLKISCRYAGGEYPLGHFAVSVTSSEQPSAAGVPAPVVAALQLPPTHRNSEQTATLDAYFLRTSPHWLTRRFASIREERPLPPDPTMEGLKTKLTSAQTPIRLDPPLVQLRQDFQQSTEQADNVRLTAAQDLAWALINNPEFLFNH
jgi:hypothetical protein